MIVTRTPLRISFAGGGSDLPDFYKHHGGAVLSAAINKYIYITANRNFDASIRLKYSKVEEVEGLNQVEHSFIKECLKLLDINKSIEITSLADISARGTGLGSSSAYIVGILKALYEYRQLPYDAGLIAKQACEIEIEKLGFPVGKQDHYSAAFGGMNFFKFNADGTVEITPLALTAKTRLELMENLLLMYTGITRKAVDVLKEQQKKYRTIPKSLKETDQMVKLAFELKRELEMGHVGSLGEILHKNWLIKKNLVSGISNPQIDEWYNRALKAGAVGGKLLGAGGGGFFLFFVDKTKRENIIKALPELRPVDFAFEDEGVKTYFIR